MLEANQEPGQEASTKVFLRWPEKLLGPAPGLIEINLVSWGLFLGFVAIPLGVYFWVRCRGMGGIRNILPVDFIYFYGDGRLANEYPLARLYDYKLQLKTFNDVFLLHGETYGPSPYPPFVALFFIPFARLSFAQAYLLWMGISLTLYLIGIGVSVWDTFQGRRLEISLVFCFALSFYPFVINSFANGQLAAAAVFSIGLAAYQERRSNMFCSGLALSILAYKPTLTLVLIPMLFLTRRLRTMLGFLTGAAALVLISIAFGGVHIWSFYLGFLRDFGRASGVDGQAVLQRWKYVDFSSVYHLIPGGQVSIGRVLLALVACASATWLGILLWKSSGASKPAQCLVWAATITWTLLLNVYVPIYDSVLVIIALILTIGALRELGWGIARRRILFLAVLTIAIASISASIAKRFGVQLLTIVLFLVGLGQLLLLRRAILIPRTDGVPPVRTLNQASIGGA